MSGSISLQSVVVRTWPERRRLRSPVVGEIVDLPVPLPDDEHEEPAGRFRVCRRKCASDAGADPFGLCPAHRAEYDAQAAAVLGTRPTYSGLSKYGRSRAAYRRSVVG